MPDQNCTQCTTRYTPCDTLTLYGRAVIKDVGLCPECRNAVAAERQKQEALVAVQDTANRRRTLLEDCGMPPEYHRRNFSTWKYRTPELDKVYQACVNYAEEFPIGQRPVGYRSLYLWSENHAVGTGKTHLAAGIVHEIYNRWKGEDHSPFILWYSEPRLFAAIQATFNYTEEEQGTHVSASTILKGVAHCDLLVLDDTGKERRANKEFLQRTMFDIIDQRDGLGLPILLTGNLNATQLKIHLGEASYSRFFASCKGRAAEMGGGDYRQEKG